MFRDVDVLIPARAGSVGLPGKNRIRLGDRSLFLHSVASAQLIVGVRRILVSTDDPVLANEAAQAGAYVPELRPAHLATGLTPMADVIRYATQLLDPGEADSERILLLLDPTSPARDPSVINDAITQLRSDTALDGFVSVSTPSFNPLWVGVVVGEGGVVQRHPMTPHVFTRRQDVPPYWRINGSFYAWRASFAKSIQPDWIDRGTFLGIETPELLSHSIDTAEDLQLLDALLASRTITLPWMDNLDG